MSAMNWSIEFRHEFEVEFDAMDAGLQDALLGGGWCWPNLARS